MRLLIATTILVIGLSPFVDAAAPNSRRELEKLSVDSLTLQDGPRLLGLIVNRDEDGNVTMAVQRSWLKQHEPAYYRQLEEDEQQKLAAEKTGLPQRIRDWQAARAGSGELIRYLAKELERLEKQADAAEPKPESQLLLLTFPAEKVRRMIPHPKDHRQITMWAWQKQLVNVETRTARSLSRELEKAKVDLETPAGSFADRLPVLPDDGRQWRARRAIIEYSLHKRLDFQGRGDLLFRTGEDQPVADAGQLLAGALKSQLEKELADLLGTPGGKPAAAKDELAAAKNIAEREDITGFRVTQVAEDLRGKRVEVTSRFLAQMPDGKWETIWRFRELADATKKRPDLEKRIAQDPQIQKALGLVEKLAGNQPISVTETAIKFGAATMEAQQNADDAFFEFQQKYDQRTDGPPLLW